MTHRLLAVLTDPATVSACLDAAALAAPALPGCQIEALHVDVDPDHIIASPEEIDFQQLREKREGTPAERTAATHVAVIAWRQAHPDTPFEWQCVVGRQEEVVTERARNADAVVLARGHDMDSGDAMHAAVFTLDALVLLAPSQVVATRLSHIAIAWSGSEASAKVVANAMPWLAAAERVTILLIDKGEDAARKLVDDLGRGGIRVGVHAVAGDDRGLGAQIVAEAHAVGGNALVAGAYRHNALIEWALGGTTRHLLSAADLPLFLAH